MNIHFMNWSDVISQEMKHYVRKLVFQVSSLRNEKKNIFPQDEDIFRAFKLCPFEKINVVILGQDPYHNNNQAHGLAFSVPKGIVLPPSLKNIYKELLQDLNIDNKSNGDLSSWAKQGVLLLNRVLTVEAHKANSHDTLGWQVLTDFVIQQISQHKEYVVFLLWGSMAQKVLHLIDHKKHFILTTSHPSPLSAHRGFLGCGHFSLTNQLLNTYKSMKINWSID